MRLCSKLLIASMRSSKLIIYLKGLVTKPFSSEALAYRKGCHGPTGGGLCPAGVL